MQFNWKLALTAGAAWGVLAGAVHAQSTEPTVEELVVTARRTEENLQSTPVAISAFTQESLTRQGAVNVTDLQGAVPNLNLVQGRGSSNATNIYIRGVGQPDALQTFDPAVGVYVDDVYISRIRGTQFDLLDLARVAAGRLRLDPALGVVIVEFLDSAGKLSRSTPTEAQLRAYRQAQINGG
jgi:iron complex outermembrane receptor protein